MKTLSDPRENLVNYKPRDSSIGRLRKKPHPHVGPNTKRIEGVETTNYRVAARLVEMKLEEDRDIHLVVAVPERAGQDDDRGVPPTRPATAPRAHRRKRRWRARSAIIAACGQPSSSRFIDLKGRATVTGVGFFDIPHGPDGSCAERDRASPGPEILGVELLARRLLCMESGTPTTTPSSELFATRVPYNPSASVRPSN